MSETLEKEKSSELEYVKDEPKKLLKDIEYDTEVIKKEICENLDE